MRSVDIGYSKQLLALQQGSLYVMTSVFSMVGAKLKDQQQKQKHKEE